MRTNKSIFVMALVGCLCLGSAVALVSAQDSTAEPPAVDAAVLARGAYLAEMGGCVSCHSPLKAEFAVDPTTLTPEQLLQLVLFP
jgi:mono/diheme cytochrome c family protein